MIGPTSSIRLRRTLPAPRHEVFEAWTRAELLAQWFLPAEGWTAVVRADARVGGRYRIEVTDPDGGVHVQVGEYLAIDRPSRLVFSWTCHELGVEESTVTVEFEDLGDVTALLLIHELPDDPHIHAGHEKGWVGCLAALRSFLSREHGSPYQG